MTTWAWVRCVQTRSGRRTLWRVRRGFVDIGVAMVGGNSFMLRPSQVRLKFGYRRQHMMPIFPKDATRVEIEMRDVCLKYLFKSTPW